MYGIKCTGMSSGRQLIANQLSINFDAGLVKLIQIHVKLNQIILQLYLHVVDYQVIYMVSGKLDQTFTTFPGYSEGDIPYVFLKTFEK
jgi:hypothetical protein